MVSTIAMPEDDFNIDYLKLTYNEKLDMVLSKYPEFSHTIIITEETLNDMLSKMEL